MSASKQKTLFSIHLMQDEEGGISVMAEAGGDQPEVYEIGIEILSNLKAAAVCNPHMNIRVQPLNYCETVQ